MFPNFGNPAQLKIFWFQHLLSVIVSFEDISHLVLVFLLSTLNM